MGRRVGTQTHGPKPAVRSSRRQGMSHLAPGPRDCSGPLWASLSPVYWIIHQFGDSDFIHLGKTHWVSRALTLKGRNSVKRVLLHDSVYWQGGELSPILYFKNLQANAPQHERWSRPTGSRQWNQVKEILQQQTDLHWKQKILSHPSYSFVSLIIWKMTCFYCFKINKMWRLWTRWLLFALREPSLRQLRDSSRWTAWPSSKPQSPDLTLGPKRL